MIHWPINLLKRICKGDHTTAACRGNEASRPKRLCRHEKRSCCVPSQAGRQREEQSTPRRRSRAGPRRAGLGRAAIGRTGQGGSLGGPRRRQLSDQLSDQTSGRTPPMINRIIKRQFGGYLHFCFDQGWPVSRRVASSVTSYHGIKGGVAAKQ